MSNALAGPVRNPQDLTLREKCGWPQHAFHRLEPGIAVGSIHDGLVARGERYSVSMADPL